MNLDHFTRRLLQDALATATAAYWRHRADTFDAAKPRPGDYHGSLGPDAVREQWQRLDNLARACRARAEACRWDDTTAVVEEVLREAA